MQFGNYWFSQYNSSLAGNPSSTSSQSYFEESLSLYEESIAYSLFLRQLYYELGACPIASYTINYTALQYVPAPSAPHVTQGQSTGASFSIINLAGVNVTYLAIGVVLVAMSIVVLVLKVVKVSR